MAKRGGRKTGGRKKAGTTRSGKGVNAAFLREFNELAAKYRIKDPVVGQMKPVRRGGSNECPPGQKLTRIVVKDQFGNNINMDVCL